MENKITDRKSAMFMLFETEEGNIISTSKKPWEIRDTLAHSPYIYAEKLFIWKNLAEKDSVMQILSSDIRRKIRKSEKDGIVIKTGTGKKLIKDFYKVYCKRMHEINVAPLSKKIITNGIKAGVTTVLVAYKDKETAGGATLNKYNQAVYANGLMASLNKFNKHYVSYALHYAMMQFAKDNSAIYYSLGRSTRNSSVHNYNKHYKGEEIPLYWSYSQKKRNLKNNKLLYWIWKQLPFFITSRLGPAVSKYVY